MSLDFIVKVCQEKIQLNNKLIDEHEKRIQQYQCETVCLRNVKDSPCLWISAFKLSISFLMVAIKSLWRSICCNKNAES